jgi:regulator of sirC expression with transglutaminase-like and TPR domain
MMDLTQLSYQFRKLAQLDDHEVDLSKAALLIAATEYHELNFDYELVSIGALADGVSYRVFEEEDPLYQLNTISEYLFDEIGFRGNQEDYYDPRNSFLNEVMTRRLGIPITLSLVYIEVARRLDIPLVGIGMPGHFLVRHRDIEDLYIDPFNGGILLSQAECYERLREITQSDFNWDPSYLRPVSSNEFIARILRNLKAIYLDRRDYLRALTMIEWLVTIQPEVPLELRDRGMVYYRLGDYQQAQRDMKAYLSVVPSGPHAEAVQELIDHIEGILDR